MAWIYFRLAGFMYLIRMTIVGDLVLGLGETKCPLFGERCGLKVCLIKPMHFRLVLIKCFQCFQIHVHVDSKRR